MANNEEGKGGDIPPNEEGGGSGRKDKGKWLSAFWVRFILKCFTIETFVSILILLLGKYNFKYFK